MSSENLKVTVRQLREGLGRTQTEFGALIEKGLATVQRYETLVPPKGKVLVRLEKLARENGFTEYADAFRGALIAELGMDRETPDERPLPFARTGGAIIAGPETPEEENKVAAFCQVMREAKWPGPRGEKARKEMKQIDQGIQRVLRELINAGRAKPDEARAAAIIRLHRDGLQPKVIAEKLNASVEQVEAVLSFGMEKHQ
jgi:hypothetical protein